MARPAQSPPLMSIEEFLAWDSGDDLRYELIDGVPVPLFGQSQPSRPHGAVSGRFITLLNNHFDRTGRGCVAETPNAVPIRAKGRRVRGPDVVVRCGPTTRTAEDPVIVVEVLSPDNTMREMEEKEADYRTVPSIRYIIRLAQDGYLATVLRRAGDLWVKDVVSGPDGVLRVEEFGFEASLADIYRDVLDPEEAAADAEADGAGI